MYIHKNPVHAPLTSPPSLSGSAGGGGHCGNARHIIYIIIHTHTFQRFRLPKLRLSESNDACINCRAGAVSQFFGCKVTK